MTFTGVFALIDGFNAFGLHLGPLQAMSDALPFSAYRMERIIPVLVGTAFDLLFSKSDKQLLQRSWKSKPYDNEVSRQFYRSSAYFLMSCIALFWKTPSTFCYDVT
jgi:hypothetical protein